MSKIEEIFRIAYDFAYDLGKLKKQYSEVKIYDAAGDISKRWYVYYSFRNPITGKLERQPYIDTGINTHKNNKDRISVAKSIKKAIEQALIKGYDPYRNNNFDIENKKYSIADAFEIMRKRGKLVLSATSYKDFKSRVTQFESWLTENNLTCMNQVTRKTVIAYLRTVLEKTSLSNQNNTRANLSMGFGYLVDEEIIPDNFIKTIKGKKSKPVMHKTYSTTQEAEIFDRLQNIDPELGLFIEFVSYCFLRPIEICRIMIENIDTKDRHLRFKAKNKAVKLKIIPEIIFKKLPELKGYDKKSNLFSPNGISVWNIDEANKRGYWTKRFKRVIKDHFDYGVEYTMYSFRHTLITRLYNNFLKELTPFEAKSKLMLITGHNTMTALDKYLRDIDAVLPEDYSKYLENK